MDATTASKIIRKAFLTCGKGGPSAFRESTIVPVLMEVMATTEFDKEDHSNKSDLSKRESGYGDDHEVLHIADQVCPRDEACCERKAFFVIRPISFVREILNITEASKRKSYCKGGFLSSYHPEYKKRLLYLKIHNDDGLRSITFNFICPISECQLPEDWEYDKWEKSARGRARPEQKKPRKSASEDTRKTETIDKTKTSFTFPMLTRDSANRMYQNLFRKDKVSRRNFPVIIVRSEDYAKTNKRCTPAFRGKNGKRKQRWEEEGAPGAQFFPFNQGPQTSFNGTAAGIDKSALNQFNIPGLAQNQMTKAQMMTGSFPQSLTMDQRAGFGFPPLHHPNSNSQGTRMSEEAMLLSSLNGQQQHHMYQQQLFYQQQQAQLQQQQRLAGLHLLASSSSASSSGSNSPTNIENMNRRPDIDMADFNRQHQKPFTFGGDQAFVNSGGFHSFGGQSGTMNCGADESNPATFFNQPTNFANAKDEEMRNADVYNSRMQFFQQQQQQLHQQRQARHQQQMMLKARNSSSGGGIPNSSSFDTGMSLGLDSEERRRLSHIGMEANTNYELNCVVTPPTLIQSGGGSTTSSRASPTNGVKAMMIDGERTPPNLQGMPMGMNNLQQQSWFESVLRSSSSNGASPGASGYHSPFFSPNELSRHGYLTAQQQNAYMAQKLQSRRPQSMYATADFAGVGDEGGLETIDHLLVTNASSKSVDDVQGQKRRYPGHFLSNNS
tara:strand:- start:1820 stop:3991 length:2172 start_codon:yes stop_codon:yes gene_type:complete